MRVYDKYSLYFEISIIQGVADWDKGLNVVYFLKSSVDRFWQSVQISSRNQRNKGI